MSGEHEHPEYANAATVAALSARITALDAALAVQRDVATGIQASLTAKTDALDARLDALEGNPDPDPEPPPPPPPPPPPAGTNVPAGTGLAAAISAAASGATLVLRGGNHVLSGGITTTKALTLVAYPGEQPVITWNQGTRPNGPFFRGGPVVCRGLTFRASGPAFTDSMGSALAESDGGSDHLYEDCIFIGHPDMTERQQMLYLRYGTKVVVRRCLFDANGTDGFGVHNYPGKTGYTASNVIVEDCTFTGFGVSAAITSEWPITVRRCTFQNSRAAIQLRALAGGSILEDNRSTNVTTRVEGVSLAGKNTWL